MARFLFLLYLMVFFRGKTAEIFGNTDSGSLKVNVVGATDTYKCFGDPPEQTCYNVSSYSLWQKKTELGCRGEGLIINYGIRLRSDDLNLTYAKGYLANKGAENNIYERQIFSKNCKVIRRYYVNKESSLVTVGYYTEYLDNSDIGNFILTQLRQQSYYWQYFIFKSGLYNESEDTIEYFIFLFWSFLLFCTSYTVFGGFKNILSHMREFKKMYVIHKTSNHLEEVSTNSPLICYRPSTNNSNALNQNQEPLNCYQSSPNINNLASLNPNMGYRIANNTNKEALLEAFKQKIGYESDKETLMEAFKQNLGAKVKNQKQIKNS